MYSFGLIGCGNISHRHAENMKRMEVRSAVCNGVKRKAEKLHAQYNCRAYYFLGRLLECRYHIDVSFVEESKGLKKDTKTIACNWIIENDYAAIEKIS